MTDADHPSGTLVSEPMSVAEQRPAPSDDERDVSPERLHRMSRRFGERLRRVRQPPGNYLRLLE